MNKIKTISITQQQSYAITAQMILLLFIGGAIFSSIFGGNLSMNGWSALLVYALTMVAHELIHGLGFYMAGTRPKFGVGRVGIIPYAYATSADERKIKLTDMIIIGLLPFISLSVVFIILAYMLPMYQGLIFVGFLGNFAGGAGDLWIVSKLLKYRHVKDVMVEDTKIGVVVYSADKRAKAIDINQSKVIKLSSLFYKSWTIITFSAVIIQSIVPPIMLSNGFSGSFTLGTSWFYLLSLSTSNSNTAITFNLLPSLIIGFVGAAIYVYITKSSDHNN